MVNFNERTKPTIPVILLAAGASSRHSHHKLLAKFSDHTLVEHAIKAFTSVANCPILLVTGAHREEISATAAKYKLKEIYNEDWKFGLGRSLAKGVEACIEYYPDVEAVIVSVCDQAYLDHLIVKKLLDIHQVNPGKIVVSRYLEGSGPPSLFPKEFFAELLELKDDLGAKSIIRSHRSSVLNISFELGHIDLDTDQDFDDYLVRQ